MYGNILYQAYATSGFGKLARFRNAPKTGLSLSVSPTGNLVKPCTLKQKARRFVASCGGAKLASCGGAKLGRRPILRLSGAPPLLAAFRAGGLAPRLGRHGEQAFQPASRRRSISSAL